MSKIVTFERFFFEKFDFIYLKRKLFNNVIKICEIFYFNSRNESRN